jgi:hypothetical protein
MLSPLRVALSHIAIIAGATLRPRLCGPNPWPYIMMLPGQTGSNARLDVGLWLKADLQDPPKIAPRNAVRITPGDHPRRPITAVTATIASLADEF